MNWWKGLKGKVSLGEPLKRHTTFKIGGPAKFFIEPKDTQDLKSLLSLTKRHRIPLSIIGSGSNLLVCDKGINRAVLRLSAFSFTRLSFKNDRLEVGGGARLSQAVSVATERGLSGLEFLAGIPGTVGGAVVMNAGAWGETLSDVVEKVSVMDYNGKIKNLARRKIKFAYRDSNLSKYIILSATLKLERDNRDKIKDTVNRYLSRRKTQQDLSWPSAGCIFKNPSQGVSAGLLIDRCGLKGTKFGGAYVSTKHANFILNTKNAKAKDVMRLMALVKRQVRNNFKVKLEPEIKIWQ